MARVLLVPVKIKNATVDLSPEDAVVVQRAIREGREFSDENSVGNFLNSLTRVDYLRMSSPVEVPCRKKQGCVRQHHRPVVPSLALAG